MSLNAIQLQPQLLADLYANSLVETHASVVPEKTAFRFLGDNRRQVAIVVRHASTPFLPDAELAFLTSILSACRLSMADIAIINFHLMDETQLQDGLRELNASSVLLFGIEPPAIGLPISFPAFQLQQFNKRTYLHSPVLSEIEKDKGLKQKLWSSLKTLFGI